MKDWTDSAINSKNNHQGTAGNPQETATVPQETATMPQSTATAPVDGGPAYNGSQADIVVKQGKVLKVYKSGYNLNDTVLRMVKRLKGKGVVVDLFDFGTMDYEGDQRKFELMEYCPEGAVSGVDLKGNKEAILSIVSKVAEALNTCHQEGFIHKDVKPANILIRNKATWDCVLCDFGIADALDKGKVVTHQSRTPIYAAPEVYERIVTIGNNTLCELSPAADFYSLGMTILSLWYGESAFRSKEAAMAIQKVHDGIVVPTDIPEPLYTITRGLLVKDPYHRWGWKEIHDFLRGAKVEVYNEHQQDGLNIIFNSSRQQVAHSVEELAAFMVADQGLAIKYLYSGKISKWLEHIPELQIEIENIIEKEFPHQQQMGLLAAIHTLNPFYDLNLCCDIHDADYAMTGESIGKVLNQAYWHYFTKGDADTIVTLMAESFIGGGKHEYLPWFFDHKGNRFTQQRKWFNYCVNGDTQNSRKAGPKDSGYLHQVAMMKTIAGFNATPEYRLSRNETVLRSIDDVYRVSKSELRYDLQNNKGLRGWLAVMCHENPHADLTKKYTYEKLLEQYVQLIGYIDSDDRVYSRYSQAQNEVKSMSSGAKNKIRGTWTASLIQKLMVVFLAVLPLGILLTEIVLNIIDNPSLKTSSHWISYLFYGIGIIAAVIAYFTLDSDGCLIPIIVGTIVSFLITLAIGLIQYILLYLYAIVVLGVLVFFSIKTLFGASKHRRRTNSILKPGFEEMTLEPLYYAFSNEKRFDSSLNGNNNSRAVSLWGEDVRKRWGSVFLFIGIAIVLLLFRFLLPQSERMDNFDKHLKINNIEAIQNDTVHSMPNTEP